MTSFNISAKADYNNQKIKISYAHTGIGDFPSDYYAMVINSQGYPITEPASLYYTLTYNYKNDSITAAYGDQIHITAGTADIDFGVNAKAHGIIQSGVARVYNSNLMHTEASSTLLGVYAATGLSTSSRAGVMTSIPAMITRGDSVFKGKITGVSSKNLVYYTGQSYNIGNFIAYNSAGDLGYIYSGVGSGTYFTINSTGTSNSFYTDINCSGFTGSYFQVMPRFNITGNTAWSNSNLSSTLYTDKVIPTGLGHVYLDSMVSRTGAYVALGATSGYPFRYSAYVKSITSYGGRSFEIERDLGWDKDLQVGDVIYYRQNSSASTFSYAVIYHVGSETGTPITYLAFPSGGAVSNLEDFTDAYIYRHNITKLMTYPQFNEDHLVMVYRTGEAPSTAIFRTPSASLEITANDYDSAYSNVGNMSHFHIGPVLLSNGERLNHRELIFSGSLYNSDPTQITADKSWQGYATTTGSVSERMTGQYYRLGAFVGTYNQSFISSDMLTINARVNYGTANISSTLNIPVQPSV